MSNTLSVSPLVRMIAIGFLLPAAAMGGPRASVNYAVPVEAISGGQATAQSASYGNTGTLVPFIGTAQASATNTVVRSGFLGELYQVVSLQLGASLTQVGEGHTTQLSATATLDDLTTLHPAATDVMWTALSGPVQHISSGGLLTAGFVSANSAASVRGYYQGISSTLALTVLDIGNGDFNTYASAWQAQYFGSNTALAAPFANPSGDGIVNLLKWAHGLNPTVVAVPPATAMRSGGNLILSYQRSDSAVAAGAIFTVEWTDTLGAADWHNDGVVESLVSDNGTVQQVMATIPSSDRLFARLRVTLP